MKDEQDLKVKEYSNDEVTIVWKPELCYHSKNCVHNLPEVFDAQKRPWIDPQGTDGDAIIKTVRKCPSGALTYYLNETGKPMAQDDPTQKKTMHVMVSPNGPLIVDGDVQLDLPDGEQVVRSKKTALCRCGASGDKPFCDGSHTKVDFKG